MSPRPPSSAAVALLFAAFSCAGCGAAGNRLTGSLSGVYDLAFDRVSGQLVGPFLVVEYVRAADNARPLKMSVDLDGYVVVAGAAIDLAGMAGGGGPRATLQRIVEGTIDLPLKTGTLRLDAVPAANSPLDGHFTTALTMPSGRTLNGDFSLASVSQP